MTRLRWVAVLSGAVLLGAAKPKPVDIASIGWMSGSWVATQGDEWTEERWSPPRRGTMLGTNLSGKGAKAGAFEFLRIDNGTDGRLTYWGSPGGRPAVPFRMVSMSADEVVFENPAHDFPTRIVYRRSGETMIATISGPGGRNSQSWTFRRGGRATVIPRGSGNPAFFLVSREGAKKEKKRNPCVRGVTSKGLDCFVAFACNDRA